MVKVNVIEVALYDAGIFLNEKEAAVPSWTRIVGL